MSLFGWVVGSSEEKINDNPIQDNESIEVLLNRLRHTTRLEDKREAISRLQDLAGENQLELGRLGLTLFLEILDVANGTRDNEITQYTLETLQELIEPPTLNKTPNNHPSLVNSDFLLSNPHNIEILLDLLRERHLWIRLNVLRLLQSLFVNRPKIVEDVILRCSAGLMSLVDTLSDNREEIRNDLILLLLKLTESNQEIQKFIVFQEGLSKIFEIIFKEGTTNTSVVIKDSLQLLTNLLHNNFTTQKLFVDSVHTRHITTLLQLNDRDFVNLGDAENSLNPGKAQTINATLNVLATLVPMPDTVLLTNDEREKHRIHHNAMLKILSHQEDLLLAVSNLSFTKGVPANIRVKALSILGGLIRGCNNSQTLIGSMYITDNNKEINVLNALMPISLIVDTNHTNGNFLLEWRAAEFVLDSFLLNFEEGQMGIIGHTIIPPPEDVETAIPAGRLLVDEFIKTTLESLDVIVSQTVSPNSAKSTSIRYTTSNLSDHIKVLRQWVCSQLFSRFLQDNSTCKEIALRISSTNGENGDFAELLFDQCIVFLLRSCRSNCLHVQVSLFRLLCVWMTNCSSAVEQFLSRSTNFEIFDIAAGRTLSENHDKTQEVNIHVQALAALLLGICVEFAQDDGDLNRSSLLSMINNRIGFENFSNALAKLKKSESFADAKRTPTKVVCTPISHVSFPLTILEESSQIGIGDVSLPCLYDSQFLKTYEVMTEKIEKRIIAVYTQSNQSETGPKAAIPSEADTPVVIEQYKSIIRNLDSKDQEAQSEIKRLSQLVEDLTLQLEQVRKETDNENEIVDYSEEIDTSEDKSFMIETLTKYANDLESKLQEKDSQIDEIQDMLQARDSHIELLNSEIEELSKRLELESSHILSSADMTENNSIKTENDVQLQLNSLEQKLLEKDSVINRLEQELSELQESRKSQLYDTPIESESDIEQLRQKISELEAILEAKELELDSSREEIASINAQITVLKGEKEDLAEKLLNLTNLQDELIQQSRECEKLKEKLEQAESKSEELQSEIERYVAELEDSKKRISVLEQDIEALSSVPPSPSRKEEIHSLQARIDQLEEELEAKHRNSMTNGAPDFAKENGHADGSAKINRLSEELKQRMSELDDLRQQFQQLTEEHEDLLILVADQELEKSILLKHIAASEPVQTQGGTRAVDLRETFEQFDEDGSGYIERSEVKRLIDAAFLGSAPDNAVDVLMKRMDRDGDDRISFDEFVLAVGFAKASSLAEKN